MAAVHPDDVREREGDFEVTASFETMYSSTCTLDNRHQIKKGQRVGRVRRIDNPTLPIPGVACRECLRGLPRAKD